MEASVVTSSSSSVHQQQHQHHHLATAAGATTVLSGGGDAGISVGAGARGAAGAVTGVGVSLPPDMEGMLANGLRQLSVRIGANCRERRAVATHQLDLLKELAAPAHARVLMWLALQVWYGMVRYTV